MFTEKILFIGRRAKRHKILKVLYKQHINTPDHWHKESKGLKVEDFQSNFQFAIDKELMDGVSVNTTFIEKLICIT